MEQRILFSPRTKFDHVPSPLGSEGNASHPEIQRVDGGGGGCVGDDDGVAMATVVARSSG